MDPLTGILDEKFFILASNECLEALSNLIDDKLAHRFQKYLEQADEESFTKRKIEMRLGEAIRRATFQDVLDARDFTKTLSDLNLHRVAYTPIERQKKLMEDLMFLQENYKYISVNSNVRTKATYEKFLRSLPYGNVTQASGKTIPYSSAVVANKLAFFDPKEPYRRSKAASMILQTRTRWSIALKGLQYMAYCEAHHIEIHGVKAVAF